MVHFVCFLRQWAEKNEEEEGEKENDSQRERKEGRKGNEQYKEKGEEGVGIRAGVVEP